jgi:hypothetical protein
LYATCSVLPEENAHRIDSFLGAHRDAQLVPIEAAWGRDTGAGRQILPGEDGRDGFFYALLHTAAALARGSVPPSGEVTLGGPSAGGTPGSGRANHRIPTPYRCTSALNVLSFEPAWFISLWSYEKLAPLRDGANHR